MDVCCHRRHRRHHRYRRRFHSRRFQRRRQHCRGSSISNIHLLGSCNNFTHSEMSAAYTQVSALNGLHG